MAAIRKAGKQALRFGRPAFSSMPVRAGNAVRGPCFPSGRERCAEPAAAGPAAAPGLSGGADGSRGGWGGSCYFSAFVLRLAGGREGSGRQGSVMVAVVTARLPATRGRAGRRCRLTGPRARPRRCRGNGDPGTALAMETLRPLLCRGIAPGAGDAPGPWIVFWKPGHDQGCGVPRRCSSAVPVFHGVLGKHRP